MVFSSTVFLFLFLPAVIAAHFIAPVRWRNAVLLVASLIFYGWGEPGFLPVVAVSVVSTSPSPGSSIGVAGSASVGGF